MEIIDIKQETKKAKQNFVLSIVFVSLFIVLCLVACLLLFFFSKHNYLVPLIVDIVITSLLFIGLIFYFGNVFPFLKHYYGFYLRLSNSTNIHKKTVVYDHEIENKYRDGVKYRQLVFSYNESGKTFFDKIFVLDADELQFENGKTYHIFTFENTLLKFEEFNHAETK